MWVGMSDERSLMTTDSSLGSTLDTGSALTPDKTWSMLLRGGEW